MSHESYQKYLLEMKRGLTEPCAIAYYQQLNFQALALTVPPELR